jgi:hypothetical protein
VAVSGNTLYDSNTIPESVFLAEVSPVSCHNRKVSGYTVACPVVMEEGDILFFNVSIKVTQSNS